MKKIVRGILVCLFVLLLVQPAETHAEETEQTNRRAVFQINKDIAKLRLEGLEADGGESQYELLFFAQAEADPLWVYVNQETDQWYPYEELEKYSNSRGAEITEADGLVRARKLAVKIFEKTENKTMPVMELLEARGRFADASYRVTITDAEKTENDAGKSYVGNELSVALQWQGEEELQVDDLYIRMEEDDTVLPLKILESLYGITGKTEGNILTLYGAKSLFEKVPDIFVCTKKDSETGITLEKCTVEIMTLPEETTEGSTEPETQTGTESLTESESQTEAESSAESEAWTGSEGFTEPESQTETESFTESESQTETESFTESESQTGSEGFTEPESQTEAESLTELETQTESAGSTESAWQEESKESETSEALAVSGTQIQTENQAKSGPAQESETAIEALTESEGNTDLEIQSATEAQAESETQAESKAQSDSETQAESETQTESETRTESETQSEEQTVTEMPTETETQTETQSAAAEGDGTTPKKGTPAAVVIIAAIILAAIGGSVVYFRKRSQKEMVNDEAEGSMIYGDDEDTIVPEERKAGRKIPAREASGRQKVRIQSVAINNRGRVRSNNEDSFYVNGIFMPREKMDRGALLAKEFRSEVQMYAVCDGMGGTDSGEDASFCAVKELAKRETELQRLMDEEELKNDLRQISDRVYEEACQRKQKSGTTIAMMLVNAQKAVFANVGDSRIYRFRNSKLEQISLDHSKVQRMISMGLLTPEQARTDKNRHVITQFLGMSPEVRISPYIVTDERVLKEDIYLLCSDGLTDMLEDTQIEKILQDEKKLSDAVKALFDAAMKNGGRDNTTIILVHIKNDV